MLLLWYCTNANVVVVVLVCYCNGPDITGIMDDLAKNARIEQLEEDNKLLTTIVDATMGIGGTVMGSTAAMVRATFGQLYRQTMTPGTPVSDEKRVKIENLLGIKDKREFMKYEREFKAENPRYDTKAVGFVAGARKQPAEKPRLAATKALKNSTLATHKSTATKVAKLNHASQELAQDGLKKTNPRFNAQESIKYSIGFNLNFQSPNKKTKKQAFNGSAKRRKNNDIP